MNILITLPKDLIAEIVSGNKLFEMRKCLPRGMKFGEDGFFVVEKGTNCVRCWCRVDNWMYVCFDKYSVKRYASLLCVPEEYVEKYAYGKMVYLWKIGKVKIFENLKRYKLHIDKNPQQFAYCSYSYGEPF